MSGKRMAAAVKASPGQKRRRSKPRAVGAKKRPPRILVSGSDEARTSDVAKALGNLRVDVHVREWGDDLADGVAEGALAVVLVQPVEPPRMALAVRVARELPGASSMPLIAALRHGSRDSAARAAYDAGATAVLSWPRDGSRAARLVAELLGMHDVRGPAKDPDAALERLVEAHVRLTPDLVRGPFAASCEAGRVSLVGQCATFDRGRQLVATLERIPGVDAVETRSLRIPSAPASDERLARALETVTARCLPGGSDRVSLVVRDGNVTVTTNGIAGQGVQRLVDEARQLFGVRSVTLDASSADRRARSVTGERREEERAVEGGVIAEAIRHSVPRLARDVSVECQRGRLVLRGRVDSPAARRRIGEIAVRVAGARPVVNLIRAGVRQSASGDERSDTLRAVEKRGRESSTG